MTLEKVESLENLINLKEKDVVVVVGSHGKTTFCLNLCEELEKKEKKTAFTTTVKIFQVDKKYRFYNLTFHIELEKEEKFLKENFDSFLLKKINKNGVYILGVNDFKVGKIKSLPMENIKNIDMFFDYTIIEGDGSKRKPLKGWIETEPVYLKNTTKSVGVIPINIVGERINYENIHRMERFLEISQGKENEFITLEHLYNVVTHKNGLFQHSIGEKILLINCVETIENEKNTFKLYDMIKKNKDFKSINIIATSLENKKYYRIEKNLKKEIYNKKYKISAIVMASGKSERMGRNKLLLEYKGLTFIENILEKILNEEFYEIIIVLSSNRVKEKCEEYIEKQFKEGKVKIDLKKIHIIENNNFHKGQSESIKLGLKNLEDCNGYMFFSADQPNLASKTIKKIIENFDESKIIIPKYNSKKGLPTLFGGIFKDEFFKLEGDTGGKPIIENNKSKIKFIEIKNEKEGMDIDTEEEYEKLKRGN
ncbi:MAG: putative selenium-dependent hydroxylase accessory protein YqeC [Leptotrichiaceae bacterium]|nr:putative selenium-dependent hydroxylase accessory protein YqeC [Leptotrichiaceae bacterium]MBP6281148.1 putative selenium-dependent hydroxylase accessory protein YqeC [Leptotrichiaceae bacterium]MBP7100934.1 putative selenium-dependent hydroxylase accessory protein YqeC [Leptotrichiaceae bacterium]MBP7739489.1 putative selenium-dependent hydroxylase accessory protein YqeC [Leptotrichiaceae bacterium]